MPSSDFTTIVSGLPRSGTSLMMRMLEAGGIPALTDRLRAADPDNPRGYYEFEPVKRTKHDASWLAGARGRAAKMVHLLLYDLPPAGGPYRIIFMRRRLTEVIASQTAMLQRTGKQGSSLPAERLMQIYDEQVRKVLAWLRSQPAFRVLEVDYNALLAAPEPGLAAIAEFLDLPDTTPMRAVIEPSLYRQRG
jgi:hypothetical protein